MDHRTYFHLLLILLLYATSACKKGTNCEGQVVELAGTATYDQKAEDLSPGDTIEAQILLPQNLTNIRSGNPYDISPSEIVLRPQLWSIDREIHDGDYAGPSHGFYQVQNHGRRSSRRRI